MSGALVYDYRSLYRKMERPPKRKRKKRRSRTLCRRERDIRRHGGGVATGTGGLFGRSPNRRGIEQHDGQRAALEIIAIPIRLQRRAGGNDVLGSIQNQLPVG